MQKHSTALAGLTALVLSACPVQNDAGKDCLEGVKPQATQTLNSPPSTIRLRFNAVTDPVRGGSEMAFKAKTLETVAGALPPLTRDPEDSTAELLNSKGEVLWAAPFKDPRLAVALTLAEVRNQGTPEMNRTVSSWLAPGGPWEDAAPLIVEFPEIDGAHSVRLISPNRSKSLKTSASQDETQTFSLTEFNRPVGKNTTPLFSDDQLTRIAGDGPIANRINVLLLSDGYKSDDLSAFRNDAQRMRDGFLESSPFRNYASAINVWTLSAPSPEAGATCDDHSLRPRWNTFGAILPIACVNALFGSKFSERMIWNINVANILGAREVLRSRASREAGRPVNPQIEIVILDNTTEYAGTATPLWASLSGWLGADVFVHEFGHSFGALADEYVAEGDPCAFWNWLAPNISDAKRRREDVKWSQWIDASTPIPTPDDGSVPNGTIGLFLGASSCPKTLYRPARTCRMRVNAEDFCHVCKEQVIHKIYSRIRVLDGEIVAKPEAGSRNLRFSAPVLTNQLRTQWLLDGKVVSESPVYTDLGLKNDGKRHRVELRVHDATPSVRKDRCKLVDARGLDIPASR